VAGEAEAGNTGEQRVEGGNQRAFELDRRVVAQSVGHERGGMVNLSWTRLTVAAAPVVKTLAVIDLFQETPRRIASPIGMMDRPRLDRTWRQPITRRE